MTNLEAPPDLMNDRICVELAVNLTKQDDLTNINNLLTHRKGVKLISSDAPNKTIQLELVSESNVKIQLDADKNCCSVNASSQPQPTDQYGGSSNVHTIQRLIEKETGIVTVVKGIGKLRSAVAELKPPEQYEQSPGRVIGVVRLSQLANEKCFVDGLLEGFANWCDTNVKAKTCSLAVHEFGDLQGNQYNSIGKPIVHIESQTDENIVSQNSNFAVQKVIPGCDITSMIGRSLALTLVDESSEKPNQVISAGVIARAATIDSNKKQICSCSGKTIWQERIERQQDGTTG